MVFMMLAGVSFALYFVAWRSRSLRVLWADPELRAYFGVVFGVDRADLGLPHGRTAATPSYLDALRHTAFHVISVATTGGYAISDYAQWPPFAPVLMIGLGCFATCAGSTGGGIKMIRVLLLLKQSHRELVRIVHPNIVNPVVIGDAVVPPQVLQSVLAYMMIYGATIVSLTMLLLFSGLDVVTAFTAVIACVNNIGPGLGEVGPAVNYGSLSDFQTWVCTLGMLLGPHRAAAGAGALHAAVLARLTPSPGASTHRGEPISLTHRAAVSHLLFGIAAKRSAMQRLRSVSSERRTHGLGHIAVIQASATSRSERRLSRYC